MKQFNNVAPRHNFLDSTRDKSRQTTQQFNKGFGILEVVIATGILVIVIAASVVLSKMAVKSSVISLERVQAYNLAQQGMELVRAIRDTNWIDGNSSTEWNYKLSPGSYGADVSNWQLIGTSDVTPLDNKDFTRVITISSLEDTELINVLGQFSIPADKMIKVKVAVSWTEYSQDWTTELYTYLSDWKPGL